MEVVFHILLSLKISRIICLGRKSLKGRTILHDAFKFGRTVMSAYLLINFLFDIQPQISHGLLLIVSQLLLGGRKRLLAAFSSLLCLFAFLLRRLPLVED